MIKDEFAVLIEELEFAGKAYDVLNYSYQKCQKLTRKSEYDVEELETMEALASRFARLCDIMIQKIFRLIEKIDQDTPGTVRDRINMAAKKDLIESEDMILDARALRNSIAHEYSTIAPDKIFERIMKLTPGILKSL